MSKVGTLFHVDLVKWVYGTVEKVERDPGLNWNDAWYQTFQNLGGKNENSGNKCCPKKGAEALYLLGYLYGFETKQKNRTIEEIILETSKNGAYSILAIEILSKNENLSKANLWKKVQEKFDKEGFEPAISEQGAVTVAFKLWQLGKIKIQ